jgi:hypothetical protein
MTIPIYAGKSRVSGACLRGLNLFLQSPWFSSLPFASSPTFARSADITSPLQQASPRPASSSVSPKPTSTFNTLFFASPLAASTHAALWCSCGFRTSSATLPRKEPSRSLSSTVWATALPSMAPSFGLLRTHLDKLSDLPRLPSSSLSSRLALKLRAF